MKSVAACLVFLFCLTAPAFASAREGYAMDREKLAENAMKELGAPGFARLRAQDPELAQIMERLIYGEIRQGGSLDAKTSELLVLAALTASQGFDEIGEHVDAAFKSGASAAEIKEALYQCAPYVGIPRVEAALRQANKALAAKGVSLPLEPQGTVSEESRLQAGIDLQRKIFGSEVIDGMRDKAPAGQKELAANYLSAWCFGDFYSRKVLDLKMRELVTFSAIVALGGCDPQARAHAGANISVGNSKQNLVDALSIMLPYIGFPRTLNGLAAVNEAVKE